MGMDGHRHLRRAGTSLIEVVVAIGLVALLLAAVAPVTARAVLQVERSRLLTIASASAASQLDRLRALPWYDLPDGNRVLDAWSLLQADGFTSGGQGLLETGGDSLEMSTAGHADVVPPPGAVPAGTLLTRRWRISGVPADPSCLLLIVEVAPAAALVEGLTMEQAALGRAQTVRCADGVRP